MKCETQQTLFSAVVIRNCPKTRRPSSRVRRPWPTSEKPRLCAKRQDGSFTTSVRYQIRRPGFQPCRRAAVTPAAANPRPRSSGAVQMSPHCKSSGAMKGKRKKGGINKVRCKHMLSRCSQRIAWSRLPNKPNRWKVGQATRERNESPQGGARLKPDGRQTSVTIPGSDRAAGGGERTQSMQ